VNTQKKGNAKKIFQAYHGFSQIKVKWRVNQLGLISNKLERKVILVELSFCKQAKKVTPLEQDSRLIQILDTKYSGYFKA
jgi:hypothetical protein